MNNLELEDVLAKLSTSNLNVAGAAEEGSLSHVNASKLAVQEIILGTANILAEKIPNAFQQAQAEIKLDEDEDKTSSESTDSAFVSDNTRSLSGLENFRQKLKEDERLSQIYKLRHNFSERFDNRAYIHPHGTTNFDYKAIPERRKPGFERFKNKVRIENYKFLANHPEIRAMITLFVKKLLTAHPHPADPAQYMAEFFSTRLADGTDFHESIAQEVKRISRFRVNKLRAKGLITLRPRTAVESEDTGEPPVPETDANFLKRLNIGPLAQDFYFDGSGPKKKVSLPPSPVKPKKKKCKICPAYCVCIKGKGVRRKDVANLAGALPAKCPEDGPDKCGEKTTPVEVPLPENSGGEEEDSYGTSAEEETDGEEEFVDPGTARMADEIVSDLFEQ